MARNHLADDTALQAQRDLNTILAAADTEGRGDELSAIDSARLADAIRRSPGWTDAKYAEARRAAALQHRRNQGPDAPQSLDSLCSTMKMIMARDLPVAIRKRELAARQEGERQTLNLGTLATNLAGMQKSFALDAGTIVATDETHDASKAASFAEHAKEAHRRLPTVKCEYAKVALASEGARYAVRAILAGANPKPMREVFNACWQVIVGFGLEARAAELQNENKDIKIGL